MRHTDIQGRRGWEAGGTDWTDAATSQGTPRILGSQQKLGQRHAPDSPSEPAEEKHSADTLTADSGLQTWESNHFYCKPPSVWEFLTVGLWHQHNSSSKISEWKYHFPNIWYWSMEKFFAVVDDIESLILLFQPKRVSGFPRWLSDKEPACNAGDAGLIPGSEWSPGEENGNPLQYSCLGNPMDRGAWWAIVCGVTKESDTTYWLQKNTEYIEDIGSISIILIMKALTLGFQIPLTTLETHSLSLSLSLFSLSSSDVKLFGMDSTYSFFMTSTIHLTIYISWYICSPYFIL